MKPKAERNLLTTFAPFPSLIYQFNWINCNYHWRCFSFMGFFSFLIFLSWGSVFVINSRLGTRLSVNRASLEIVRIVALAADVGCGGGALMQIPFLRIREGKSFARRTARKVPVGGGADGEEAGREAVSNLIFRRPTDVLIFLFLLFQMNQLMVWFRYIHRY